MPGNSWRNLRPPNAPSLPSGANNTGPSSNSSTTNGQEALPVSSPRIDALMQRRQDLQNNMQNLVTGAQSDPREAARFPVATFAQRQAEQRQWEQQRQSQPRGNNENNPEPTPRVPGLVPVESMRTGLQNFQQPVGSWLSQRDQDRQSLRENARSRTQGLQSATQPVRNLGRQLGDASSQLRDLDRKLASEGLESDRQKLKKLGTDKILKADKTLKKINKVIDAPQRAVAKIDDFWQRKSNNISGAMDRFGPYVENSRRRLNSETGGSGDLFERMQRNRERALEQKREQRRIDMRDQQRRERARTSKKEKEDY